MVEELLKEYKEITEKAIKEIENEADVDIYLDKREEILKKIFSLGIDRQEIKEIYKKLSIDVIDSNFKNSIIEEQNKVKEEIKKLHKSKNANRVYGSNIRTQSFFNRKI
ncbi:hypothetical protein [Clostridium chauvoei]|uniref:Flagellar protein FliT n=2 Tax=Clostridium chauvoei TaxID=46867 RepID=S6F892_9CLOT|nr:hypothetical protein [Clostridium chauvoei]ATD54624.1 hypothetical protein BTM20_04990 [Clostridium chauvoei]ATD57695.1 hypothetical protein BTM21_08070 [Clostridium chauvoei]MBX7281036.1 flagellar protein FliT [Clostridium chauvoei]MBX7283463.1 flagellar protein FliT [Clostridium chauvoei]MBX7286125.1 flagellar protein FliT [Clostridium chauvoei]